MKKRLLIIGPSMSGSKGGMASVIQQEHDSEYLRFQLRMDFFASYKDGRLLFRCVYCFLAFIAGFFRIPFYDVLHIHMTSKGSMVRKLYYARVGQVFKKRVVIQLHCTDHFLKYFNKMPSWYKHYAVRVLKRADAILCLSGEFSGKLAAQLQLENCHVLPNGIAAEDYSFNAGGEYLVYMGKIREDKGIGDLLEALKLLREKGLEPPCVLCGTGDVKRYEELAAEYGLNHVSFKGWVSGKEKLGYLKNGRILILPSYHEGFPIVILEGMASGCAIIATSVGAVPEMISDSYKPGSVSTLADMIEVKYGMSEAVLGKEIEENHWKVTGKYNIRSIHMDLLEYLRG